MKRMLVSLLLLSPLLPAKASAANPPPPTGAHPRLFLTPDVVTAATANALKTGTAAAALVKRCKETVDSPQYYTTRGGADGDNWPGAAVACAFAWVTTKNQAYLDSAIANWNAALDDDQTKGDKLGCIVGATADAAILTVKHDTGYPIRWYGPYLALTYDWLHDAPGVNAALLSHSRSCFKAWIDYYTAGGYMNDVAGANYGAGYVAAKTFIAIAEAGEDGAISDGYWTGVLDDVFAKTLIGKGLIGSTSPVGTPAGPIVGGDWPEGWQYGPLSVLEYAFATRAVEAAGAPQPAMDAWASDLVLNYLYALTPARDTFYSDGDLDSAVIYPGVNGRLLRAAFGASKSTDTLGYARSLMDSQKPGAGDHPLEAIAEVVAATVTPVDFYATPGPLFHLARGTRTLHARSAWDQGAFWGVFTSSPRIVPDHNHVDAGNFVLSRGKDHLVVDPSGYGSRSTLPSNAPTVNADTVQGDYKPSQTAWSEAELLWARGTESGVAAARGDHAKAYNYSSTPSDIPYAVRDWVFLPEGEIAIIDRVRSNNAGEWTELNFHTMTQLALAGKIATATVATSDVAIHTVALSGGTPTVHAVPETPDCYNGTCTGGRFATFAYSVQIPGPKALAIHVIDALAQGEAPATVGSMNEAPYDAAGANTGIVGAAVWRSQKQTYVIASSAQDGKAGAELAYTVPGSAAARHVVFDAPEDASGSSDIAATTANGNCAIRITAGPAHKGRPLIFQVAPAADGCTVVDEVAVVPSSTPLVDAGSGAGGATGAGGSGPTGGAGGGASGAAGGGATSGTAGTAGTAGAAGAPAESSSGCSCTAARSNRGTLGIGALIAAALLAIGHRRGRRERG
jgi:hypothetical protein